MEKLLCLFTSFTLLHFTNAQDYADPQRWQLHSIGFSSVLYNNSGAISTYQDFLLLAPESAILKQNLSGFNSHGYNYNIAVGGQGYLSFLHHSKKNNPLPKHREYRIGVQATSTNNISNYYYKTQNYHLDTLHSEAAQTYIYIDSVVSHSIGVSHWATRIELDLSATFCTMPVRLFKVYCGGGITVGATVNARTAIYESMSDRINVSSQPTTGGFQQSISAEYRNESFQNKSSYAGSAYLSIGCRVALGKKRDFWKRLQLTMEVRPQINITDLPELRTYVHPRVGNMFGLRYIVSKA
ncbi:MAG: hypothetical protein ACKVOR_00845 [Flavobacteriales bacterium]